MIKSVLHMGLRTSLVVMGLLVLTTAGVLAADEPLQLTLEQFAVIPPQEEGAPEELIPFTEETAEPGTVIEYRLVARNMTDEPIPDIILQLLVPQDALPGWTGGHGGSPTIHSHRRR